MFDFYYQSGEFVDGSGMSLGEIILQLLVAFIGAGAAIGVYYLQTKNDKKKQKDVKDRFDRDSIRYIYHLFHSSIDTVEKDINYFQEAIVVFNNSEKTSLPEIGILPINDLERIVNKIEQEKYFHAITHRIIDSQIELIFTDFDYFYSNLSNLPKEIEKLNSPSIKIKEELQTSLNSISDLQAKILERLKSEGKRNTELFVFLNENLLSFHKIIETNPFKLIPIRQGYIRPLLHFLVNIKDRNEDVDTLMRSASKANKNISYLIANNTTIIKILDQTKQQLVNVLARVKPRLEPIEKFVKELPNETN